MTNPDPLFNGTTNIVKEIYDAVLRLTGRVETLISQHDETKMDVRDHETRIRQLESGRWPLPTLSVILAAAALVLTFVKNFL